MDTQAVDSGFSSSSPADRQSPSPKVRLALESPDTDEPQPLSCEPENAATKVTCPGGTRDDASRVSSLDDADDMAVDTQMFREAQSKSGCALPTHASDPHLGGISHATPAFPLQTSLPNDTSARQASVSPANAQDAAEDFALDLSANSTSFPRLPSAQPDSITPSQVQDKVTASFGPHNPTSPATPQQQPGRIGYSGFAQLPHQPQGLHQQQQLQLIQQQHQLQHQLSQQQHQHPEVVPSLNGIISSLTAQITGAPMVKPHEPEVKAEVKRKELDPAHLIKHNIVAEPPNCGCVNKTCECHLTVQL